MMEPLNITIVTEQLYLTVHVVQLLSYGYCDMEFCGLCG